MTRAPFAEPRVGDDSDSPRPNVRPLGYLALVCGVLSIFLAPTFFLSLFAIPLGVLAVGVGLAARTEGSTRKMGTIAVALALTALLLGTTILTLALMTGDGG